jgi:hypothetical protein
VLAAEGAGVFNPEAERRRVDGGKAVQLGLDFAVIAPKTLRVDESRTDQTAHVGAIASVVALELGQRLRVGIEVTKCEPASAFGKRTSLLPPHGQRDEIARRAELDIDLELVLQAGDRAQDRVLLGHQLQVDVDRGRPPAGKYRRRPADQIADAVMLGSCIQGREQALDPLPIG